MKTQDKLPKTLEQAKRYAAQGLPIADSIAAKYLQNRAIDVSSISHSRDLKYLPKAWDNQTKKHYPALLSIARNKSQEVAGVQVIYLDPKTATKAPLNVKKRSLGRISGNTVQIQGGQGTDPLTFIAEGVETALSIANAVSPDDKVLATLGKSNFVKIKLGALGQKVILCLDNDGIKAFKDPVIKKAVERLQANGKEVFIAIPKLPTGMDKADFNDILKRKGTSVIQNALSDAVPYHQVKNHDEYSQDLPKSKPYRCEVNIDTLPKQQSQLTEIEREIY